MVQTIKASIALVAGVLLMAGLSAQTYSIGDDGSAVKFTIKNFALNVGGSFKGLKGKMTFNPANLPASSVMVTIDANTVNTGNNSRDNHLRKEEYLNVAKFPLISFSSSKITKAATANSYVLEGKITIKGVAKNISIPFTAVSTNDGYLLEGEVKLNRRDFGVGGNSMVMSDNLTVALSVTAKK